MISEFKDQNRWLSNFVDVSIILGRITYPSVEHAYMSEKIDSKTFGIIYATLVYVTDHRGFQQYI